MSRDRMNAPTFAYLAVYGELPPDGSLRGRTSAPTKTWKGIPDIDVHIKDEWLGDLNSIEEIEMRATDEGKSEERVAFVIFRMTDPSRDSRAESISERLDKMRNVYSECDIGAAGRPRVVVAGKVQYGEPGWEEWWNTIAEKIEKSLQKGYNTSKEGWYLGKFITEFLEGR